MSKDWEPQSPLADEQEAEWKEQSAIADMEEAKVEDTVTIIEDYYKDDKGVWYRWRFPNEERWHLKLTGLTDLPYVRFKTMSKAEFKEYYPEVEDAS